MNAPDKIWAVSYYTDDHDGRITAHVKAQSASAAKDACRREREDCARIVRVIEIPR